MKKKPTRSAKKRSSATRKSSAKRSSAKKSEARKSSRSVKRSHEPTRGLYGWITHTELVSTDPVATKAWCVEVLGWTFRPSVPMPGGVEYMLFAYSDKGGGGIRPTGPSETPGSSFTVHVADTRAAFEKALREGAEEMVAPTPIMPGVTIAVVRAPGGVPVGFSGP
jgi:predicted enzyme related to lactoylglutathione lyase